MSNSEDLPANCEAVLARLGFTPFDFQRECWEHQANGESGILTVPTGSGKTIAAVLPALCRSASAEPDSDPDRSLRGSGRSAGQQSGTAKRTGNSGRLRLLYITPLRTLARDIERQIRSLADAAGADIAVESRTGDTSAYRRKRQLERMPEVLITTPESFALMLSREESGRRLSGVQTLILDEWHELFGSKRGTQCELCAATLRRISPRAVTWALSATIGNLEKAARAATGENTKHPRMIRSDIERVININLIAPDHVDTFPWAGHLGRTMAGPLLRELSIDRSTIIFCNTRSQAERWYQELIAARPEYLEYIALHHGSIDRAIREEIETRMLDGRLKWVVATSSLDLGIDFHPVERVVQVGSAKGIARLMQRAGRSGHSPGRTSELFFVPTHTLEILELAALRRAISRGDVEPRQPPRQPHDVLVQHLITRACGYGFTADEMYDEVCSTYSYRNLSRDTFDQLLGFAEHGGSLSHYPQYRKISPDSASGRYEVHDNAIARLHRMGIGTITSDSVVTLRSGNNAPLGSVEESFIGKLRKGDTFYFAGRTLELVQIRDGVAHVRNAKGNATATPSWAGGRLPFSTHLGKALREELARFEPELRESRNAQALGSFRSPEATGAEHFEDARAENKRAEDSLATFTSSREEEALSFLLNEQKRLSVVPGETEILAELVRDRSGTHLFLFPFEGHEIHEALGALYAYRFSQMQSGTFTISVNDYGVSLFAPSRYPFEDHIGKICSAAADEQSLREELRSAMNLAELARTRFRGIARIAGLVIPGFPGKPKSTRQIQVSSSLLFDVFREHDPQNLLLSQAFDEALHETADFDRLKETAGRIARSELRIVHPERPSPLGFPLYVERMRARLSSESFAERVARLKEKYAHV